MRFLHTMLRVRDLDAALDFFVDTAPRATDTWHSSRVRISSRSSYCRKVAR